MVKDFDEISRMEREISAALNEDIEDVFDDDDQYYQKKSDVVKDLKEAETTDIIDEDDLAINL